MNKCSIYLQWSNVQLKLKNFIMKIAITSQGSQLDSIIDQRFGRCSYFVIYDTEKQTSEFLQNPNKLIEEGAGPASVQFLANQDVEKVVSGEFGVKIKPLMDQLKMGMIIIKEPNSIEKIIRVLNTKEYWSLLIN